MVDPDPVSRTDEDFNRKLDLAKPSVPVGDEIHQEFWNFRLYVGLVIRLGKEVQFQRMYVVVKQDWALEKQVNEVPTSDSISRRIKVSPAYLVSHLVFKK